MAERKQAAGLVNGPRQTRTARGTVLTGVDDKNEARNMFLANINHELRTPLNGLLGMADLLERTQLTTEQHGMLEVMRESGQRLARMLSDVLDQADIVSGRITLLSKPFTPGESVRAAVRQAEGAATRKGLTFLARISSSAEQTMIGDPVRLEQIIANLADNAVKFTDRGTVIVSAQIDDDRVCRIVVSDTGVGIHPMAQANIFQSFRRGDCSSPSKHDGLGLGLSLAKRLADLIGGQLECRSLPGQGSAFVLTIQMAGVTPSLPTRSPPADRPARPAVALSGEGALSVLVVDDHQVNRELLKLALMPSGVRVVTAENGAEACDIWSANRFDLVIMDLQMPVMDGLTAIRRIRAAEASRGSERTPVVVFTANATVEQEQASFHAGADHFLTKPLVPSLLMAKLRTILQSSGPSWAALGTAH